MKIRTDFVTNSSSSSFVVYELTDSDFCRYLYAQMQNRNYFILEGEWGSKPILRRSL